MSYFHFKNFSIKQEKAAMKVGTDSMVLGALIDIDTQKSALDIGTGTGVLSLMQAQKKSDLEILALEIEQDAYSEAIENVANSNFKSQIVVKQGDFLHFPFEKKYDLIFSNPPFFENSLKSENLQKNFARHTDSLPFDLLFEKVSTLLNEDASFYVIVPLGSWEIILDIAAKKGLFLKQQISIFGKLNLLNRFVFQFSNKEVGVKYSEVVIRNEDNSYTNQYICLTKEFHNRKL
jgi:tRNA1Val (adenine37-N6)-methyltransferase